VEGGRGTWQRAPDGWKGERDNYDAKNYQESKEIPAGEKALLWTKAHLANRGEVGEGEKAWVAA